MWGFFSSLRATGRRQTERTKHGTLEVYLYLCIHLTARLSSKAKGPLSWQRPQTGQQKQQGLDRVGSDAAARTEAGEGFSPREMAAGGEDAESLEGEGLEGARPREFASQRSVSMDSWEEGGSEAEQGANQSQKCPTGKNDGIWIAARDPDSFCKDPPSKRCPGLRLLCKTKL